MPFDIQLQRCQRYYLQPARGTLAGERVIFGLTYGGDGSDNVFFTFDFPVQMRDTPALVIGSSGSNVGSVDYTYLHRSGMQLYYTGAGTSGVWLKSIELGSEL